MASPFLLLAKHGSQSYKLSFTQCPSVDAVCFEVTRHAQLAPDVQVVLSVEDPDFPTEGPVVLNDEYSFNDKQVVHVTTKPKVGYNG